MVAEPSGHFDHYFYCSELRGINRRFPAKLVAMDKWFRLWLLRG